MKTGNRLKEMIAERNNVGDSEDSEEDEEDEKTEQFVFLPGRDWQKVMDIIVAKGFIGTIRP